MSKLIFFDIDGTLVAGGYNKTYVPESAKVALKKLREAGHFLALTEDGCVYYWYADQFAKCAPVLISKNVKAVSMDSKENGCLQPLSSQIITLCYSLFPENVS